MQQPLPWPLCLSLLPSAHSLEGRRLSQSVCFSGTAQRGAELGPAVHVPGVLTMPPRWPLPQRVLCPVYWVCGLLAVWFVSLGVD